MLPFENMVADYVKETNNHVLYRVTPIYEEDNLLTDGVLMEGYSVEDKGDGVTFCVFAYNAQPGVKINYVTGKSESLSLKRLLRPFLLASLPRILLRRSRSRAHLKASAIMCSTPTRKSSIFPLAPVQMTSRQPIERTITEVEMT